MTVPDENMTDQELAIRDKKRELEDAENKLAETQRHIEDLKRQLDDLELYNDVAPPRTSSESPGQVIEMQPPEEPESQEFDKAA